MKKPSSAASAVTSGTPMAKMALNTPSVCRIWAQEATTRMRMTSPSMVSGSESSSSHSSPSSAASVNFPSRTGSGSNSAMSSPWEASSLPFPSII